MKTKSTRGIILVVLLSAMLAVTISPRAIAHTQSSPYVTDLMAAKYYDAGDVLIWNDADHLYVKFQTAGVWVLSETHLHVATTFAGIPQKKGNPIPGKFEHTKYHYPPTTEYTYEIDLDKWDVGTVLHIAAHAVVCRPTEGVIASMTIYTVPEFENAGNVKVAIVGDNLVFTINQTMYGWKMLDSALYAGLMPPSSFYWYLFPSVHLGLGEAATDQHVVSLSSIGVRCGDTFYVSATTYSVFRNDVGEWFRQCWAEENPLAWTHYFAAQIPQESKSAWGSGLGFPGSNWAMHFTYTVQ